MELLRTIVTVVELGSVTRAANALGRSQPAASLQMKRLETLSVCRSASGAAGA
ncbi:MAG: helix-turn-helix domain-containing protein [Dongiaceae bacterium]